MPVDASETVQCSTSSVYNLFPGAQIRSWRKWTLIESIKHPYVYTSAILKRRDGQRNILSMRTIMIDHRFTDAFGDSHSHYSRTEAKHRSK